MVDKIMRSVQKPIFDVHYGDRRTSLVIEADLDRGWKKRKKTYGFFAQTWIPYRNDLKIRAQMSVIAQPGSFEQWGAIFPDIERSYPDDCWSFNVTKRQLVLKVPLVPNQPWRKTKEGRPEIFVDESSFLVIDPTHWFDLKAWIIFHENSASPVPDVRVWAENKLILPGGQFEANRRRH